MTENQSLLFNNAQAFVTDLFLSKVSKTVKFHTLEHTQNVLAACETLAEHSQLNEDDRLALSLAALFHDTGYAGGQAKDHETVSVKYATDFLNSQSAGQDLITKVVGCINATRMPQNPTTEIERIICDADLYHLGTDLFKEKNRLLRDELKEFGGENWTKRDWWKANIDFLEKHKYFTAYAREKLQPIKEVHLAELKEKMSDLKPDKKDKGRIKEQEKLAVAAEKAADAKKKKDKENQTERGIATVFRIMANNHASLSQMADSKANILISVNSIIISIVVSTLFSKLETNPYLQVPVIVLVTVCVSAIVFSILATRPNVSSGTFAKEDIVNKKTNLLFFGNFHKMSLADYDWGMTEMMNDKNYLYSSMIKDIYFLGVVLAKKYRYLRIAYTIFMFGIVVAMLAFALTFLLPQPVDVYTAG